MTKLATSLRRAAWVLAGFACLAASSPAWAQETSPSQQTKLDEVVRQAVAEGRSVRAIVRFTDEAARKRGAGMVSHRGGHVRRAFNAVGALCIDVDAATADALAADSGTVSVSIDAQVHSSATGAMWASQSSGADAPRQNLQRGGRSISVAVIDSGVRPHADLPAARIRKFVDFVNGRTAPYDDFGHGTHVAGIVAGSGAASLFLEDPYVGAAPDVDVVALKVLDRTGAGRTSDVLAALEWVAANHTTYNIRVVNLSLGHPVFEPAASDPLVQAAEALARRGIVVVASAGNLGIDWRDGFPGSGGITSPANGPSVIAVGAVDNKGTHARGDDSVPGYSSRGPTRFDLLVKPDLVASAHHVVSLAAPESYLFEKFPGLHVNPQPGAVTQYMTLSGTSMAAPLVAGTAALILDANPRLTAATVRAVLEFTAQQLPDTNLLTQGAGSVNAQGAVRLAGLIKPGTEVGQIWLQSRNG
ncbi:MAG: S8 family peptidase, partial [Acidobacteria bacterium]|nr:S8 family peptidase [Acidobacteriota bacterium]